MASTDETFPAADGRSELEPGRNKDFKVDPVSSEIATSVEIKKQAEAKKKENEEKKDALQSLKKTVIISGIIVAIAGAAFAITKKLKEK